MTLIDGVAFVSVGVACVLVIVSSFVKTMIPLRWLAVGSNLGFIAYGLLHDSWPTLLLNAALLPINVVRVVQMIRLTRRVAAVSQASHLSGIWLKPYMRSAKVAAGEVLFRQGDRAERMYMLADGLVEFVEIGTTMGPGTIFGEIAFFSPSKQRLLSARCVEDSTVLSIDESTVKQLYFQNPAFGFELMGLVSGRLSADVERLRAEHVKPPRPS
jgi:hypothetical protein